MKRIESRIGEKHFKSSSASSNQSNSTQSDDAETRIRPVFLVLPILLPASCLLFIGSVFGLVIMYAALAAMVAYLFGPMGREVVIPAAVLLLIESLGAGIWEAVAISVSVASVDIFLALFVVLNFGLVNRSERLSRVIDRMKKAFASKIGERPTKKGYLLLAGYVAFPLQFSGGFVAAIIGSLLGFDPKRMLLAVSGGSVVGSLAVGLLAYFMGRPILDLVSLDLLQLAGILIVVGFIIAAIYLYYSYRRKKDGD